MWWVLLSACAPSSTSSRAFVGRVVDEKGIGQPTIQVTGISGTSETDSTGGFVVGTVRPGQAVAFELDGTWYRRAYSPETDDGRRVDLVIPKRRKALLKCPAAPCDLALRWTLPNGLEAIVMGQCTSDRALKVPLGEPVGSCRGDRGAATAEALVADRGDTIWVYPAGRTVRVEVRAIDGGRLPDDCGVSLGPVHAEPAGEGVWSGDANAEVTVAATCAGRPAVPMQLDPVVQGEGVTLDWSRTGPSLDLATQAPWADLVTLRSEVEPSTADGAFASEAGWTIRMRPSTEGTFLLPPLPAGMYRLEVQANDAIPGPIATVPPAVAGQLVLLPGGERVLIGTLWLDRDLLDGRVPVR